MHATIEDSSINVINGLHYGRSGDKKMKTEVTVGIMLIIIMASTLSIGFNVMPTEADSYIDQFSDQNYLRNANADSIVEPDAQDFGPDQKETAEGNSTTRPTTENKWTFNSTNEWTDFANVDEDSAELVVGVNNTKPDSYAQITALIAENGGQIVNTVLIGGEVVAVVADISFEAMSSFVQEVRATGLSRYVEPNLKFRTNLIPNDPYWPLQWGPAKIEADYAWNTTIGDPSVLVAVIDTGIDWNHPDLVDNYVPLGYDWVNMDSDPMDDHGHGTHCAGIIAATLNNDVGVAGLAQISIAAEKALDAGGWGTEDDLASAIIHAVDQGADILSNSWSSYGESALIHEAVQYAYEHDVLIVAAAGNDAGSTELYPAAYDEVIAVTATDQYDDPAWWTNFGDWVELAAPGVDIYSTVWNDGYTYMSGTSMSTPHVAGVAALILSKFPNMTRDRARLQLRFTADDLGDSGFDHYYGYGRVNARRAVEQAPTDHDLLILNWDRPRFVELHDLAIVNTTVFNFGTSNETDITVQLLVNGSIVDFGIVDFLETATSVTVNCSWTPTTEGTYNLTSYVVPVPGETFTENNIVTAMVPAGHLKHILFDQTHRTDSIINYNIWVAALTERGYAVDTHTSGLITPTVLADYMAFIIPQAQDSYTPDELSSIQNFVIAGGGLLVIGDDAPSVYTDLTSFAGINWVSGGVYGITTDITPHEVTREVTSIYLDAPIAEMIVSGCAEDLVRDPGGGIMLAVSEQPGRVIGFADEGSLWDYGITYQDNLCLASNMIDWLVIRPEHDLAVTLETPPYIEPGDYSLLNVTVRNRGLDNEIHVDLFLFINCSAVKNVTIPELISDSSYTMDYLWMPAIEEGVYNITGYAVPVENEEITENNVASTYVYIGYPVKAFVLDSAGTDFSGIISTWQSLSTNWYMFGDKMLFVDYSTLNKEDIAYEDLAATDADVLIISCASDPGSGWEFTDLEIEAIDQYVHEGHGLIATSGTFYSMVPNNNKLAPLFGLDESTTWEISYTNLLHLQDPTHPLFTNVPNPYTFPQTATTIPSDGRWDPNELTGGEYAALGHFQESAIVVYRGLVYISPLLEYGIPPYYHFHLQLLYNAITWSSYEKPEHELVTCLEAPPRLKPGESLMLNATFFNMGLNNETDVELFLLINSTVVNSTKTELLSGECYTINYLWTPTDEAIYNVTAYAPPVPDENFIINNVKSVNISVTSTLVALFKNVNPWDLPSNEEAFSLYGVPYVVFSSSDFGTVDLDQFSKIVIASDQDQVFYNDMGTYRWWFEDYVRAGGILEIHAADFGWHGGQWVGTLPGGLLWVNLYADYVTITDPAHPVVTTPNMITDTELDYWHSSVHGVFSVYPVDCNIIVIEDSTSYPAYLEFEYGAGFILASSQTLEWANQHQYSRILENSLLYTPMKYEHDLGVTLEAPVFVELGNSTMLEVTVRNRGLSNETNVELHLLINGTLERNVTIQELLVGESYTISHMWTPAKTGNCNVTVYAPPVPDEEYITNNIATKEVHVFFYARQYLPHEWIGGGVPMAWHADDDSWAYTLPFDFPFYEIYFRTIYISSNGLITFTGPDSSCGNSVPSLATKLAVAPAWDDWVTYNPHDIYIWQNSTHVGIRWYVASYGDRSIVANFEAVLAADGAIRFNYGHNNGPVSATIGISNGAGHILAEDKGSIHYVNSIVFTPFERNVAVYNVTVYPTKVYVGQTVSINVTVGNKGETPENLTVRVYYENASEYSNSTAFPTGIPNEPHPANAIWVEPSFTDLTNYSIGERFNVTAWLNLTEPSFAWQINLIYDKTILNATRCGYTANSQSQFFEGLPTIFIAPAFLNINVTHAYVIHAESLIGVAEREPGCGSLSWIEFEIISKPPEPYEGYLELGIEPSETFVYDPELNEIPITRYHGVYGFGISPPPSPLIGEQKIYLLPGSNTTLTFAWNTTGMLLGNYTIKAVASSVPGEIDVEDNTFVDGVVEVLWQHDIAVIKVSPSRTWVYEGHTVDFNVTVRNEGDFTENVTIILYYNITAGDVIDIGTIENLHPQENKTVTLIWDTSGVTPCRNYTITAIATIPMESDATDNALESPLKVKVRILGDINGDGKVDIKDIAAVAVAFGSYPGLPRWNHSADLSQDGKIDIRDIALAARNFGKCS